MKNYSKILIIVIIALNVLYAIGTLLVFYKTGSEPTVLTTAFYGFTTVELWQLATIKKHKITKTETTKTEITKEN